MTTRTLIPFPELLGPGIIGGPPARRSVAALTTVLIAPAQPEKTNQLWQPATLRESRALLEPLYLIWLPEVNDTVHIFADDIRPNLVS